MIVISVNDANGQYLKNVYIPENLGEVTVRKYIEFEKDLLSTMPPPEADEDTWIDFHAKHISFWSGLTLELLNQVSIVEIVQLSSYIIHLLNFEEVEFKGDISEFKLNGNTYYLPKKTNAVIGDMEHYLEKVTLGEYATAQELRKAFDNMKQGDLHGVAAMIAILCRREGEQFPATSAEQTEFFRKRKEEMLDLKLDVALNVAFFLTKGNEYLRLYFHALPQVQHQVQQVKSMVGIV
jgi:hypothetical protein